MNAGFVPSLLALLCLASPAAARPHVVEDLSPLEGFERSGALGVNEDGTVVVGLSRNEVGPSVATVWRELVAGDGRLAPSSLPTSLDRPGSSVATAVSDDGRVIVGMAQDRDRDWHAVRWSQDEGLDDLGRDTGANGVSADGSVVVGWSGGGAFRWTRETGMVSIPPILGHDLVEALGVSGDGSVVVGQSVLKATAEIRGFRWTEDEGTTSLGVLQPDGLVSARAVSRDGSVIVGHARSPEGLEAFRWTAGEGLVGLGQIQGVSSATGVSADGEVVVGFAQLALHDVAFRWSPDDGMEQLELLHCNALAGRPGFTADALSADGRWVVGSRDPGPQAKAYRGRLANRCASNNGDYAPGVLDTSTSPPTWRAEGDGVVDVGDMVVSLRAAVGLQVIDCEP